MQKAKFLEEAMNNRQPENEDLLFFAAFYPTSTTYQPIWNYVSKTASNKLLTSLLILHLLQHSSPAHFHCSRRLQPHLLLIVIISRSCLAACYAWGYLTELLDLPPNSTLLELIQIPTNTQWIPKSSVCLISSSNTKFI